MLSSLVRSTVSRLVHESRSDYIRKIANLSGGMAIGQVLIVATTPLITRLYDPKDFGLLGLFMSFYAVASAVVTLRYDLAIVSARDEEEANTIFIIGSVLLPIVSLFACGLYSLLISHRLYSFGHLPMGSVYLLFSILTVTGFFTLLRYWFVRSGAFKEVGKSLVHQSIGRAFYPLLFAPFHWGWLGLLTGELAGRMMGITSLFGRAWRSLIPTFHTLSRDRIRKIICSYWRFPVIGLPSTVVDAMGASITLPLVMSLFGSIPAGQFMLVQKIGYLPMSLIGVAIADVFHSESAGSLRLDPGSIYPLLKSTLKRLVCFSLVVYIPIGIFSPFLFGLLFGSAWSQAGILLSILSPAFCVVLAVNPVSRLLVVIDRQDYKLVFDVLNLIFPNFCLYYAHAKGLGFLACAFVYSISYAVVFLVYLLIIVRACATLSFSGFRDPR